MMATLSAMKRSPFCLLFLTFVLLLGVRAAAGAAAERPNLLFLFTDDQRWDAMGCAGNERIHTPNLDSLAASGTRFRNAFVTLSICSPSRAAALTGRYNSANGVTVVGKGTLDSDEITFAQILKQAGYRTGVTGKWHLGNSPKDCGFDFSNVCQGNGTWYGRAFVRGNSEKMTAPGFVDDFIADESIRFLREHAAVGDGAPFVLWHCTQVPHMDPRHTWPPSEEYLSHYGANEMPLAATWQDDLSGKPPYLAGSRSRTQALSYGYDRAEAIREHNRDYYASVEQMDATLGRVLAELDRLGLRENTWIFFMGDNGWMMGEHGFTSKVLPYEESIRVPMIVTGPGTEARVRDELVLGFDLTATLLEAAGLEAPERMHGRSLLALVRGDGPVEDWRKAFLYEAPDPQLGSRPLWAVRTGDWKYIETGLGKDAGEPGTFRELYDLKADPEERENLAGDAGQEKRVAGFAAQMAELKAEIAEPEKASKAQTAAKPVPVPETPPVEYSGIYPRLAYFNNEGECGTGAVVPWADRLWVITYAPHMPKGSSDKLYEITPDLKQIVRPESIGGTPANRMIHRESNQLFIGPYAIGADRNVRVIPYTEMFGRLTGNARHLTDPAKKIYYATMEEGLYEVDVETLEVKELYADNQTGREPQSGLPGYHGKGLYSGQSRVVYANNGEKSPEAKKNPFVPSGVLAEWDGKDWTVILRNQFTEVTGPGGIYGNENPETDSLWSVGWDARSLILMLLDGGEWRCFRLPKASHSYDGAHGWNTEWPRIRDIGEDDLLMTMHGMFWRFPRDFRMGQTAGIAPRSTYLKVVGDFCRWRDRIVLGCDDTAHSEFLNKRRAKGEIEGPQSQSNLWFLEPERLDALGPVIGRGAVWLNDEVPAGEPSDPYLFSGFAKRAVHLVTDRETAITFEIDRTGSGEWTPLSEVKVNGYHWQPFEEGLDAAWIRVKSSEPLGRASAWFTGAGEDSRKAGVTPEKFAGVARPGDANVIGGLVRARGENTRTLQLAAADANGKVGNYILDAEMKLAPGGGEGGWDWLQKHAAIPSREGVLEADAASVIYTDDDGQRYRLPKSEGFSEPGPLGFGRLCREVATERDLFNCHGTFYELPAENAGGFGRVRPVSTHNLQIFDYCSYRGLFVISGINADADAEATAGNRHIIRGEDGKAALWVGAIDDIWELGKPVGTGGPWLDSKVAAKVWSDPYLMTGYDEKVLELKTDKAATIAVEVDISGMGDWQPYRKIQTAANETFRYEFPDGFQAYWVRFQPDVPAVATARLRYR